MADNIIFNIYQMLSVLLIVITFLLFILVRRFEKAQAKKILLKRPLVSIIIPTTNLNLGIEPMLKCVKNIDWQKKEIIMSVNGRFDNAAVNMAKKYGMKLILNKKQIGKPKACNAAVEKSEGEYILFLDDDTIVQKDVIKKLLARFEKNTGAVMPKYLTNNRKSLLQKMINIEELILQTSNKISQSIEGSSNVMRGCCFLVKKDIFKKLGGYMQTLTEDVEFAASLKKNNYKITFESNAVIFTHEHDKIGGWFKHKKRCGKGAFYTFLHHKSLSSSRSSLTLSIVIPFMLRICMIGIILATLFSNPYTALIEFLLFLVIEFFHYSLLISFEMKNIDFELLPLFAWIYIPLVLVAYLTGALSAAKDKLLGRDELALKDW